jgi:hypothetical protein
MPPQKDKGKGSHELSELLVHFVPMPPPRRDYSDVILGRARHKHQNLKPAGESYSDEILRLVELEARGEL